MKKRKSDPELLEVVMGLLDGLGFKLVELNHFYSKGSLRIVLVIYRLEGITLDDCTSVYKTVLPRIELIKPERDIYIEVCSPGIGRVIKSIDEFEVFKGLKTKILMYNNESWVEGVIGDLDDQWLTIDGIQDSEIEKIRLNDIQKAKLF